MKIRMKNNLIQKQNFAHFVTRKIVFCFGVLHLYHAIVGILIKQKQNKYDFL